MNIAIVGCGDIGVRSAALLQKNGHRVVGIRRNVAALPDWLESISADVSNRQSLEAVFTQPFDAVLYILSASAYNEAAYRSAYVDGVANTLEAIQHQQLKRFVFVSSTSVYHQNDGSLVDENSPTQPVRFNGQLVLEGEALVRRLSVGTVVRFSGIYGPARTRMIERVKNNIRSSAEDDGYTNRIHVDDCAGVLAHLLMTDVPLEPVYLASDSEPCTRQALETFLAAELGVADNEAEPPADKAAVKRIAGSKRCNNRLLLSTGYRFLYPDFRSGYRQVLSDLYG
jgi:nucleoside-diphosphate-sugar epimerase